MPFSAVIYSLLSGIAALTAIVGDKLYPLLVTQTREMPYVAWRMTMTPHDTHNEASRVDEYEVEIFCSSVDYDEAHEMSELIRADIDNRQNELIAGHQLQVIRFIRMRENFVEGWDAFHVAYTYQMKVNIA